MSNYELQFGESLSLERYQKSLSEKSKKQDEWWKRYLILEQLLYRGFTTVYASIGGIDLVFKSINNTEFDKLRLYYGSSDKYPLRTQLYFIAHSLFLVNDESVLVNRDKLVPGLIKTLSKLGTPILSQIANILSDLNTRAAESARLVEAYSYEELSRQNWLAYRGTAMNSTQITGIEGTQNLGLNTVQRLWTVLNRIEDTRQEREVYWDYAKFVGSCFNGTGVRAVDGKDQSRREREREMRETIRTGGTGTDGVMKIAANSVPELMDQLERSLKGEKDWHDTVISGWENKLREDLESRKSNLAAIAKRAETFDKEFDAEGAEVPTRKRTVYSLAEVEKSIQERNQARQPRLPGIENNAVVDKIVNSSMTDSIVEGFTIEAPDLKR
jgi:hypothetical protein